VQGGTGTSYQAGATFVCASATLYAQWVQNVTTSTITYDAQGGSGDPADSTCTTGVQIQLASEVPSKTGYTFIGWNTQADGNGTAYAPSSTFTCADLNLYAIWTANTSVVEFDPQGGAGEPADNTCVDGSTVVIPTTQPTRTGYTFTGWNSAPDGTGTTYLANQAIVCSDLTIYAQWTQDTVTYTVAYEPNGGTGDPADQTCTSGTTLTLSTTAPTRTGYTFTGWNTEAGGGGTAYAGGASVSCQNLTLHAQWTQASSLTVTYNPQGGTGQPADQTCTSGSTFVIPTTQPTRTGYTFAGWNSAADGTGATYLAGQAVLCNNLTIYAQWTQDTTSYTLVYEPNGGTGDPADQTCTSGSMTVSQTAPTRTGYTFTGWNTAADGTGTAYAGGSTVSCQNLTLHAQWTQASSLTVTYDPQGGTGQPADQTCTTGSTFVIPTTQPTRTGYTFAGWNSAADGTGATYLANQAVLCNNLTIYAQWTPSSSSTLVYEPNGGTGDPADQTCTSGNVTLSTTAPTRTGYTFLGWNTASDGTGTAYAGGSTVSCADLTLYAQWSQSTSNLTVTYDPQGGTGQPADQTCTSGSRFVIPTTQPTRTGYTFAGWNSAADGSGATYLANQAVLCNNLTIYAQWTQDTASFTVVYEPNGGSGDPADQTCTSGNVTLSTTVPTRSGYTFLGWNAAADGTGTSYAGGSTVSCADLTLYAQWSQSTSNLTVTYDPQGGTGQPADQTCTTGSTFVIPTTQPTRTGYTFAGWNSAADGSGATYLANQAVLCNNLTIYAQWTQDSVSSYTVAYEPNGGSGDPADQTCSTGSVTLSSTVPTRAGYTFLGWNTASDGSGSSYAPGGTVSCADVTLFAQWSGSSSLVAFEPNGGSGDPADISCVSGSSFVVPSTQPTRAGYTFAGWN
jgi:uncharacterized repeat protein (TIGR02543 family)